MVVSVREQCEAVIGGDADVTWITKTRVGPNTIGVPSGARPRQGLNISGVGLRSEGDGEAQREEEGQQHAAEHQRWERCVFASAGGVWVRWDH